MNVLIVGADGRAHAIAWKFSQSPDVQEVFVAPGNAGTGQEPGVQNVDISVDNIEALLRFAQQNDIALTVVGPESALVHGIADRFAEAGLPCFGPCRAAAKLEGSKLFAKALMQRCNIPTARHVSFTNPVAAMRYLRDCPLPIVVKADGLAAGKGVVVARQRDAALGAVRDMLVEGCFGEAGEQVILEEFLQGRELSFTVLTDGEHILPLATAQDHKARDDGDKGPNTGGMGAYSPASRVDAALHDQIMKTVIRPILGGLRQQGIHYCGFLYAGLMIEADGTPRVLEFNCRLGDPEAQVILMRLRSDLPPLCLAACRGELPEEPLQWHEQAALGVVLAASGYPGSARNGDVIRIQPPAPTTPLQAERGGAHTKIFHAGTREESGQLVTAGGRVMCVTGTGDSLGSARSNVYRALDGVHFAQMFYRRDIGEQ